MEISNTPAATKQSEHKEPLAKLASALSRLGHSVEQKSKDVGQDAVDGIHEGLDAGGKVVSTVKHLVGALVNGKGKMPGGKVRQHTTLHSHNDEMQPHPLSDALRAGSSSVEVDTHLVDGKLLIGHDASLAKLVGRELEEYYLKPLAERVKKHGKVYSNGEKPFTLEIEFKEQAEESYAALKPMLKKYEKILTRYQDGKLVEGPISVVMTGRTPKQARKENPRLVAFDGAAGKLLSHPELVDKNMTPRLNGRWSDFFDWTGEGSISAKDRETLHTMVERSQARGVDLRFWEAPDNPRVWKILKDAGVQLINTDHPKEFANWDD